MKKLFFLSVLLCFLFACKKNQLGGRSTIHGKVSHHAKPIPYATVFIKFNAKEFPGNDTTLYDDKVRADANGDYSIKCHRGDYYLYGYGFDYDITAPFIVVGGTPVKMHNKETSEINVAVTEEI
jgi:hypothetical protein